MHLSRWLSAIFLVGTVLTASRVFAAVHAGDQLSVTVYDHPELTGTFPVDASEQVAMPLAGTVSVRGLSTTSIAKQIRDRLAVYIIKPAVSVELKAQQASIFVSGGPGGILVYSPGETLIAALGEIAPRVAGGTTKAGAAGGGDIASLQHSRIDLRRVGILRDSASVGSFDIVQLSSSGALSPRLLPGDTVVLVDKPRAVRVIGEVAHPGIAYLADDESLDNALSQSGGLLPTAAGFDIELRRGATTQRIALSDARFNAPAIDGDTIVVPIAPRVNIFGLVEKPGSIVMKSEATLLGALYDAGGPSRYADLKHVEVVQANVRKSYDITRLINGDLSQNPKLGDGDLVFVPEGHKVSFAAIFQNLLSLTLLRRQL